MTFIRREGRTAPDILFTVDGEVCRAPEGENLAVALGCSDHLGLRRSPRCGTARGAFCFMGLCQECAILVDGVLRQACLVPVRAGMTVQLRGSLT